MTNEIVKKGIDISFNFFPILILGAIIITLIIIANFPVIEIPRSEVLGGNITIRIFNPVFQAYLKFYLLAVEFFTVLIVIILTHIVLIVKIIQVVVFFKDLIKKSVDYIDNI